jgi:D-arabinose 1-dehydrogenase-like Zn-dependent alcohol dehydrogenase
MEQNFEHFLYKHCDEKEADAIGWAFVNKDEMIKFPFKYEGEIGEDEIRANVTYCGLCHSDILFMRGKWGYTMYPCIPGHEIMCVVSEVGKNVTDFKKGDHVGFGTERDCCENCKYCKNGMENICRDTDDKKTYGIHWGGYSTSIQQPAKFFFKLPEGLDERRAAPLLCAGITVYAPIKEYIKPDDKCAVIGIGGLGHLAVQFLAKMGFHVTALTGTADKTEYIKSLGASEIVNYNEKSQMQGIQDRFDFVINTLPIEDKFNDFINICAPRCRFIQVGLPDISKNLTFNPMEFVVKEIILTSSHVGPRHKIRDMLEYCAKNDVYPLCEEFSFEDFPKAFDRLENGRPRFRCVVNVEEFSKKNNLFK